MEVLNRTDLILNSPQVLVICVEQEFGCLYSLDWTTGLDYWTDLFATKNHFYALQLDSPTSRVANYVYTSL